MARMKVKMTVGITKEDWSEHHESESENDGENFKLYSYSRKKCQL